MMVVIDNENFGGGDLEDLMTLDDGIDPDKAFGIASLDYW